ncbi:MAG: hypothetical protein IKQ87_11170 [Clostridia bacterium]|nr:hypothetical protein [Clostridia bacterium]
MQGLFRNRRRIWYANGEETVEVLTDTGEHTGHYRVVRGPVKEMWTNVSTTSGLTNNNISGKVQRSMYGQYPDYTLTINPLPDTCDMRESSVLWIDTKPVIDADGTTATPYDHVVVRIAAALNWRAAQAQKVDRTHDVTAAEA